MLGTETLTQLTYQVLSKGSIAILESLQVPSVKNFQIEFKATFAMIPKASVIVYYITSDGEIISDSLELEFDSELKNFVS